MTSILVSHPPSKFPAAGDTFSLPHKGSDFRILCFPHSNSDRTRSSTGPTRRRIKDSWAIFSGKLDDGVKGDDNSEDDFNQEDSKKGGIGPEFMGKNLLALNVMWKYMEQRSFPLTEEEYILRLDDVANTLKCWGAVSHVRSSLKKSKERPRIGKAVSIFIDMDESGGRANEWIYK
ncbi:hypothetical protein ACS0TY_011360 [Phlomoides rotata]